MLTIAEAAAALGCHYQGEDKQITGAQIDSRKIKPNQLFVAVKGQKTDGHDYLEAASQAGASVALVSTLQAFPMPQLVVDDVIDAFGRLAALWRQKCDCTVIGITGSNGKTTVKEMLATVLGLYAETVATEGNLNNHFGVPLTLFRLQPSTQYAVVEMGISQLGDMRQLVEWVQPTVALITNIGPAHIAGLGSEASIAKEKGLIFSCLTEQGVAIVNADMPYCDQWQAQLTQQTVVSFGVEKPADYGASKIQQEISTGQQFEVAYQEGVMTVSLSLLGEHNRANALASVAVCDVLAIPQPYVIDGLALMTSPPHRLQPLAGPHNATLLDDSYNANVASYQQALKVLTALPGRHWLVLGDFGELGERAGEIHRQLGQQAKKQGVEKLLTIGQLSAGASQAFGPNGYHYSDISALLAYLQQHLVKDVICLIKASRLMQLDKLVAQLAVSEESSC
ncbi:MAG TPA: UDP-N-acetylmuramoyl-tripeptide--D-alanyl-D-alanine ligase [Gammaproteobacteria bacterium]|nr:UDP-N-acetylmuramoyl-tripeptide--D-alanyl-D-alanine ligase [Gammaproteobacteria bacterium]